MNNSRIYLNDLVTSFLDRHISISDNLSQLFAADKIKGTNSLVRCIRKGLSEFERYMPMIRVFRYYKDTDEPVVFQDNYSQWYKSNDLDLNNLVLKPTAIASVKSGSRSITANYWSYESGVFNISRGSYLLYTTNKYPIYAEFTSDGLLTKDSHIYGVEDEEIDQFTNALDLSILKAIRRREKIVNLPMSVNFLQLDDVINDVKELVEEDKSSSSTLRVGW